MPFHLFDTHAHLDDARFADDLPEVVERAQAVGVRQILTVATTPASSRTALALAERLGPVSAAVGIHPNEIVSCGADDWTEIERLAASGKPVALGETGLDRYRNDTPFALQEDFFVRHQRLARRTGLPLIIHCRQAEAELLRCLREDYHRSGPIRGVMHSFTGSWETAEACLALGLFISFAGMVTYPHADPLRDVARRVREDRLLVETDSPYLAPVPVRGRRNEPAHVVHTLRCVAELRGQSAESLAALTTKNAQSLFGTKGAPASG